jgi:nitrogen fixation/metabolism regulation signal transduction histidine kinase
MVDPILIEQVVLNLLKNAAEAIDTRSCRRRAATSSCASCRATRPRKAA